jgi:transmembrane sensor
MSSDEGLEEQAAAAYIRQQSGDWTQADQAELDAWLADPAHERAYRSVWRAWHIIGTHSASPELIAYRSDALQRRRRDKNIPAATSRRAFGRWCAVGVLAALLVGLGLKLPLRGSSETDYRTALGEQRSLELADRSRIVLDAGTALRVRMTRDARVVDLLKGQAQFLVAHDPRRPFLVEAGASTITAVGTSFNVEYLDERMKVDMMEGKVVVAVAETSTTRGPSFAGPLRTAAAGRTLDLAAGEELNVGPRGQTRIVHNADVGAAIAWKDGKIIFKNTPLGEAVRQMNRYSRLQLRLSDPSLAQERISGVFNLGDTLVFAGAAQSSLSAVLQQVAPDLLVLSPALLSPVH